MLDTKTEMQETREKKPVRIALVHDLLVAQGGAERVLSVLADMYPEAPIYTLLHDPGACGDAFTGRDIRTSFLQKWPAWIRRRYQWLLPLYPAAVEALDLREFDVVISSSGAWSKGIVTRLATRHIAYIHSPMRYVWDYNERYIREATGARFGFWKRLVLSYLRVWDSQAADRPDRLLANSEYTRSRISKYYRRESEVVYPPIVMEAVGSRERRPRPGADGTAGIRRDGKSGIVWKEGGYFLVVSRLTKAKNVEAVVDAFNKLELPLVVVGGGPEKDHLKRIAGGAVRIVGRKTDEALRRIYARARAVVFPVEEDFGLVVAEAQAGGIPVIAVGRGGALEIIREGVTGEFFDGTTPEMIADGVRRFLDRESGYDRQAMLSVGERFSRGRFEREIRRAVSEMMDA